MGSVGVPGASASCRPSFGGRTRKGVGVPVGGPMRAVGPAVSKKRCSGAEAGAGRVGSSVHGPGPGVSGCGSSTVCGPELGSGGWWRVAVVGESCYRRPTTRK